MATVPGQAQEECSVRSVRLTKSEPSGDYYIACSPREERLHRIIEEQRHEIKHLKKCLADLSTDNHSNSSNLTNILPEVRDKTNLQTASLLTADLPDTAKDRNIGVAFPALFRGLTTKQDIHDVELLCRRIMGDNNSMWGPLLTAFFDELVAARSRLPSEVLTLERSVPEDWFRQPWYLAYVQYAGVDSIDRPGDFDSLRRLLPYIRHRLGFRNLCILPHYESPMADGGYDISSYTVRNSLGGSSAFMRFMRDARSLGMRIATEAVFNHTSTEHAWFQNAIKGDLRYLRYYIQRNGREKIAEWDDDGEIICQYRDIDGSITERAIVFPDIDRTHGLWVEINGRTYQFYRSFYPFQVDLNLQNVDVITEHFRTLAEDVRAGVLGKRLDAAAHWIKKPGTAADGLDECHAVQALLKSFMRHLHRRAVIMPEVVRDAQTVATYSGIPTVIRGTHCASEGDAIFSFEMQAALREAVYLQSVAPFWRRTFETEEMCHGQCVWINILEHHDDIYLGFYPAEIRRWFADYIRSHNGILYRNDLSAGGRLADGVCNDVRRLATAILLLYLAPGAPMVYYGTEIGICSQWAHAQAQAKRSKQVFDRLGVYVDRDACFDGRELHRGPIPRAELEGAVDRGHDAVCLVRRLNELWTEAAWMTARLQPVDCQDIGVLCGIKCRDAVSVLCMANLTPLVKVMTLPIVQVEHTLHINEGNDAEEFRSFVDILGGRDIRLRCGLSTVEITIEPYERAIISGDYGRVTKT